MRVVFFGTPTFAAEILDFLLLNSVEVCAVVTRQDQPKGRSLRLAPSAVKELVLNKHPSLKLFQPPKASDPSFVEQLADLKADLFIVVAYGEIVSQAILDLPRLAPLNIHTSLLPKYRGASPIQAALLNGDSETGVSIIKMTRKMDAGAILASSKVQISEADSLLSLEAKLLELSKALLLPLMESFVKDEVLFEEQDETKATYVKKIETKDCELSWQKTAEELRNLIRAVSPKPGAWCYVEVHSKKKRLKILSAKLSELPLGAFSPGEIVEFSPSFLVACGDSVLSLDSVQLEGKKALDAGAFTRGFSKENFSFN